MQHVRAVLGDDGVEALLVRSGQEDRLESLTDEASWSSYDQFRKLLESAVDLLGSMEALAELGVTVALAAGSMPGATEALVAMGSPVVLLAELNSNNGGTTTVDENFTLQEGPTSWQLGHRMTAGFEAVEALCVFHTATVSIIAVNLSPRQLDDPGIAQEVATILESAGIPASRLVLEITESVLAHDAHLVVPRLEELRALGVRIAIDDFGTGYSSLGALVQLPVDILKIDRTFIARMLEQPAAIGLVQVLIDMGRTLGLEVVAEGIEELDQALALGAEGCRLGQGFLLSRPLPADDFALLLASEAHAVPAWTSGAFAT